MRQGMAGQGAAGLGKARTERNKVKNMAENWSTIADKADRWLKAAAKIRSKLDETMNLGLTRHYRSMMYRYAAEVGKMYQANSRRTIDLYRELSRRAEFLERKLDALYKIRPFNYDQFVRTIVEYDLARDQADMVGIFVDDWRWVP